MQGTYINMPLDLHHPYMQQYGLSLEKQAMSNWLFSLDYIGNRGMHMRSGTEQNPAIYGPGATTANTLTRRTLYLINRSTGQYYSAITFMDDGVNTYYNGLRAKAEHRFAKNFTILSVYTWSKCLQTAEPLGNRLSGNNESNPYNNRADFGACDYDLRHNWTNSVVVQGPRFKTTLLNETGGGWQLAFLANIHTGFPYSLLTGTDQSLSAVGLDRPDVVPQVNQYVRNKKTLLWTNPAAFVANAPGTFGTTRYNSLIAPAFFDFDTTLMKSFRITERQHFDFRAEFFNVFNHTNLSAPVTSRSSANFGLIQSSNPARIIQLAGKYTF